MRPRCLTAALAALLPLSVGSIALPQGLSAALAQSKPAASPKRDYAAARLHYAAAEKAASIQNWVTAANEYVAARDISKDPVLFFKIGDALNRSGDCAAALVYFERYLAEANPSEVYRADTQTRMASCAADESDAPSDSQSAAETEQAPLAPQPTPRASPPPPIVGAGITEEKSHESREEIGASQGSSEAQPSFMDAEVSWQQTAGWSAVGVSVAFLTASAVFGLSASSRSEDIGNLLSYRDSSGRPARFEGTVSRRYETLADEGESLRTLALVSLGGAGLGAAAAIFFFVIDERDAPSEEGLASIVPRVNISHSSQSLGLSLRF